MTMEKEWWNRKNFADNALKQNKELFEVLSFYLLNCPVMIKKRKVSQRAKTFEDKGIQGASLSKFLSAMKKSCSNQVVWELCTDDVDIINKSEQQQNNTNEFLFFIENTEIRQTRSIFYYIRNSLAHGAFSVVKEQRTNVFYFECSNKGKTKARMKVYATTLLVWIRLFENFN